MLEILYYDRHSIHKTLAESLVIGGLPMNTNKISTDSLTKEIDKVVYWIYSLDSNKQHTIVSKDENDKDYLEADFNMGKPFYIEMGKYYRRGKALGQVPAGSGHNSMFKGVTFNMIIKFPLYWLKEYQRYHFTDIISSQSTMHKILEFDFSDMFTDEVDKRVLDVLEELRGQYNNETDKVKRKEIWRKIINTCPDGLHMVQGITMNYLQAVSIYEQRKNHKLAEWHTMCDFIEELPLFKELLLGKMKEVNLNEQRICFKPTRVFPR